MLNEYQKFYDYWRRRPDGSNLLNEFPHQQSLGGTHLFRTPRTSKGAILIIESYDSMFHRLMGLRMQSRGVPVGDRGVDITGQSGILGVCNNSPAHFFIARLFSAGQRALLCNGTQTCLFHHCKYLLDSVHYQRRLPAKGATYRPQFRHLGDSAHPLHQ